MPKKKSSIKAVLAAITLSLLCLIMGGSVLGGNALADSGVQSVAQSYTTTSALQTGLIVRLSNKSANQVVPATYATAAKMLGVTVAASDAAVTLSDSSSNGQQVYVASSGRYDVLVSNQAGTIDSGDNITISSLDGVGMKAGNESTILGRADASFDGRHNVDSTTSLRDPTGRQVTVAIGRIPVDIAIGVNPVAPQSGSGYVPGILRQIAGAINSQPVAAWRIYVSLVVMLLGVLVGASLLYGGVRSGMIAVGRNPLARGSIMRNLLQVIVTGIIIVMAGLFAAYAILRV